MANGDKPELTSLVGASAAPSQTPAPSPQMTPRPCSDVKFRVEVPACVAVLIAYLSAGFFCDNGRSMEPDQESDSDQQDNERYKEVDVREDRSGGFKESHMVSIARSWRHKSAQSSHACQWARRTLMNTTRASLTRAKDSAARRRYRETPPIAARKTSDRQASQPAPSESQVL